MAHRTSLLILLLSITILRHRASAGPHEPDAAKDWPRPELRAGLSDAEIAASITAYVDQLHAAGRFSGVVLAANQGKVVATHAVGRADVAANTPNTLDTRFNIGSINKLFTKVAIGQLAQAGKLSLDDTVRMHLPKLAIAGADK